MARRWQVRMPLARGNPKIGRTNYWSSSMANGWTAGRRRRQARMIRHWRPWERSTGPRTAAGKARASRNAFKGGTRQILRELARILRSR